MKYAIKIHPALHVITLSENVIVHTSIDQSQNSPSVIVNREVTGTNEQAAERFDQVLNGHTITEDQKEIEAYQHLLHRELENAQSRMHQVLDNLHEQDLPF